MVCVTVTTTGLERANAVYGHVCSSVRSHFVSETTELIGLNLVRRRGCTTIFVPNFVHSVPSIMFSLRGGNSEFDQFSQKFCLKKTRK